MDPRKIGTRTLKQTYVPENKGLKVMESAGNLTDSLGLAISVNLKDRAGLGRHCSALLWSYRGGQEGSAHFPNVQNY